MGTSESGKRELENLKFLVRVPKLIFQPNPAWNYKGFFMVDFTALPLGSL